MLIYILYHASTPPRITWWCACPVTVNKIMKRPIWNMKSSSIQELTSHALSPVMLADSIPGPILRYKLPSKPFGTKCSHSNLTRYRHGIARVGNALGAGNTAGVGTPKPFAERVCRQHWCITQETSLGGVSGRTKGVSSALPDSPACDRRTKNKSLGQS